MITIIVEEAASWRKRLGARLPPLGSRVRVLVPPRGFRGGRNGVWVGFSRGFSRFPLPQISFDHFSTLISSISFHVIRPCDGASGVVGRHPCYSRIYNISSHPSTRPCVGHELRIFIVEDCFVLRIHFPEINSVVLRVLLCVPDVVPPVVEAQYRDNLLWIREAGKHRLVVGSQARILYSDRIGRIRLALAFNSAVKNGSIKVIMTALIGRTAQRLPNYFTTWNHLKVNILCTITVCSKRK